MQMRESKIENCWLKNSQPIFYFPWPRSSACRIISHLVSPRQTLRSITDIVTNTEQDELEEIATSDPRKTHLPSTIHHSQFPGLVNRYPKADY